MTRTETEPNDPIPTSTDQRLAKRRRYHVITADSDDNDSSAEIPVPKPMQISGRKFLLTFVYASPDSRRRNLLWEELKALQPVGDIAWVLGGDFNAILSSSERVGGPCRRSGVSCQFGYFIQNSLLNDFGFQGPRFTWKRGTLHQRLDRWLGYDEWWHMWLNTQVIHLPRVGSDHRPILLGTNLGNATPRQNSFKYLAAWQSHSGFDDMPVKAWNQQDHVVNNIKCFQKEDSLWNIETFGHIGKRKSQLLARISGIERVNDCSSHLHFNELEARLKGELVEVLNHEEVLWFQRSRSQWILDGDRNTKYYHRVTKARHRRNTCFMIKLADEHWCSDKVLIRKGVVEFFKNLFLSSTVTDWNIRGWLAAVSNAALLSLTRVITADEVRDAVFAMSPLKSPGVDGVHAMFFQRNWNVVGQYVIDFVQASFSGVALAPDINRTLIVLIPKVSAPESLSQFRPISLCTVVYKTLTKVIVNRLKPFLPEWIAKNHVSFVPGDERDVVTSSMT
ncbi:hypothetical protein GQ457_09G012630 [Hibiscus cannabinus]